MHNSALEVLQARNLRVHGLLIVVVARAENQPLGPVHHASCIPALRDVDFESPLLFLLAPVRGNEFVPKPEVFVQVVLVHGVVDVSQDAFATSNGIALGPRIECEAKCVQIRV